MHQAFADISMEKSYFTHLVNNYDNGVLQGDWLVRQIFETLQTKGYLNDAMIIITGDHGDSLSEHQHLGHAFRLYNEDMRVPLLIWDSEQHKITNTHYASQVDIAPTIFSRLKLPIPKTWSGTSLYHANHSFKSVHLTHSGKALCSGVVNASHKNFYKFIACKTKKNGMKEELYDMREDLQEKHNLMHAFLKTSAGRNQIAIFRSQLEFFYEPVG